jgi:hypothetical protein
MADINVERKGASIWPWIIGLLVLALLIWLLFSLLDSDDDEIAFDEPVPAVVDEPFEQPVALGCVSQVMADAMGMAGQAVTCDAVRVAEVPSDRGFWIEEGGQRMFVVLDEGAPGVPPGVSDVQGEMAERPDINPGDMLRITGATVRDASYIQSMSMLDDDTRQILQGVTTFLTADGSDVTKM